MYRFLFSILFSAFLFWNLPSYQEAIFLNHVESLRGSIAEVGTKSGHGTGYLISDDTIITCFHVVDSTGEVVLISFWHQPMIVGKVIAGSEGLDIAVIQFQSTILKDLHPLSFRKSRPRLGEMVYWDGDPEYFRNIFSGGVLTGFENGDPKSNGLGHYIFTGFIFPGYSGSPLLDSNFTIIGMIDAVFLNMDIPVVPMPMPIAKAITADRIRWFLDANHVKYKTK